MFPDCVGDVDVISGAECIKKLLKLPYQPNGTVSTIAPKICETRKHMIYHIGMLVSFGCCA